MYIRQENKHYCLSFQNVSLVNLLLKPTFQFLPTFPTADLPDEDFAHIKRFVVWLYHATGLDSVKVSLQRKMLFDSIIKEPC